jgi:hypothetical protein
MRAAWARVAPGCGGVGLVTRMCRDTLWTHKGRGVGLVALLLAAACMVALLLVALVPATDLPPSETYLFYAYCVIVICAWTYEYAQGRMSIHVYTPSYVSQTGFKFLGRLKSLLYDSLHDTGSPPGGR